MTSKEYHIFFCEYISIKYLCYKFFSLKEFLPQSYIKTKGIEKKIFAEHKKHVGLSELDAKVLFSKTARSLPTYGVTFFLVKVCSINSEILYVLFLKNR